MDELGLSGDMLQVLAQACEMLGVDKSGVNAKKDDDKSKCFVDAPTDCCAHFPPGAPFPLIVRLPVT